MKEDHMRKEDRLRGGPYLISLLRCKIPEKCLMFLLISGISVNEGISNTLVKRVHNPEQTNASITERVFLEMNLGKDSDGMPIDDVADVTVTGTVVDQNGEAIPGVTISIPDTGIGTATDIDGKYTLTVPEGSTLVFSSIGFETRKIVVEDQSIIDVTLTEDLASLDEVVVVGYGTQKKRDLTGAVSQINADKLENENPNSVQDILRGNLAGINV